MHPAYRPTGTASYTDVLGALRTDLAPQSNSPLKLRFDQPTPLSQSIEEIRQIDRFLRI
jgi:hypothetical protein